MFRIAGLSSRAALVATTIVIVLAVASAAASVCIGRRGKVLRLLATAADDSGLVRVVEQVRRGARIVATIERSGFVSATGSRTLVTRWKAPTTVSGAYRHCIRVSDRAGNASVLSCAKLVIR